MRNKMKKIIVIIMVVIILCPFMTFFSEIDAHSESNSSVLKDNGLEVNVLGLESDGDCTIITMGDVQILIDSSEYQTSFEIIKSKMTAAMASDDGKKWDYLIFTHPDEDHIGNAPKVFDLFYQEDTEWSIGTIIDYDFQEASYDFYNTAIAKEYRVARDRIITKYGADYFSASSLDVNNKEKKYTLADECYLYILYNYYDNYSIASNSGKRTTIVESYKNLLSVCCLLSYKNQKLLFTGDLVESGENALLDNHREILKNVTFFKAGHHGSGVGNGNSAPANTRDFVDCIRPEYVAVTKMEKANNPDESINNFLKYTDYIYPTYVYSDTYDDYFMLFGDELFYFDGENVNVKTENNMEGLKKPSIWNAVYSGDGYDECWFAECVNSDERGMEDRAAIYSFDEDEESGYCNCTLIKHGHYDILIDCGSRKIGSFKFVEKLKDYVVDGVLEYVIITHNHEANISQMVGMYKSGELVDKGVFEAFQIETLIDNPMTNFDQTPSMTTYEDGFYKRYNASAKKISNRIRMKAGDEKKINVDGQISMTIYGSLTNNSIDEDDYSMVTVANIFGKKCMFLGDLVSYDKLVKKHSAEIAGLTYLRLSNSSVAFNRLPSVEAFFEKATPKYTVIGTPLEYVMPSAQKVWSDQQKGLLRIYNDKINSNIFYLGYIDSENRYRKENGDLEFNMKQKHWKTECSMEKVNGGELFTLNDYYTKKKRNYTRR